MRFFSDRGVYNSNPHAQNRLNERYNHIILPNLRHIEGKRVLDLGSYDGRWTWAALESGASFVRGFEGRATSMEVGKARIPALWRDYAGRFEFEIGDVFDLLETVKPGEYDTILCLGLFYHILNHERMIALMARIEPEAIVIDSGLSPHKEAIARFYYEDTADPSMGVSAREKTLVGTISRGALAEFASVNGLSVDYIDWVAERIENPYQLDDYFKQIRWTCVLRPTA